MFHFQFISIRKFESIFFNDWTIVNFSTNPPTKDNLKIRENNNVAQKSPIHRTCIFTPRHIYCENNTKQRIFGVIDTEVVSSVAKFTHKFRSISDNNLPLKWPNPFLHSII